MTLNYSGTGTNGNNGLIVNALGGAAGSYVKTQYNGTSAGAGFGYGTASQGIGIYDIFNSSFWLQQGGQTKNKIVTGSGIQLDTGSGNMLLPNVLADRRFVIWDTNGSNEYYGFGLVSGVLVYSVDTTGARHQFKYGGTAGPLLVDINGSAGAVTSCSGYFSAGNGYFNGTGRLNINRRNELGNLYIIDNFGNFRKPVL